MIRTNR